MTSFLPSNCPFGIEFNPALTISAMCADSNNVNAIIADVKADEVTFIPNNTPKNIGNAKNTQNGR